MIFFLGFLGAFLAIACFAAGFCLGRGLAGKPAAADPPPELMKKREEEAQAFRDLFSYSSSVAYGSAPGGDAQ